MHRSVLEKKKSSAADANNKTSNDKGSQKRELAYGTQQTLRERK